MGCITTMLYIARIKNKVYCISVFLNVKVHDNSN